MTTPITPITRLARQARAYSVPLLVAGVLAAGCGTVAANPGGPNEPAAGAASTSASAAASASASAASGSASSVPGAAPTATPVPTVSGGVMIGAGGAACAGWPANAPHGKLTALFTPVAVERCVSSLQQIKGKGEWLTATLERSTDKLATLTAVLMAPSERQPDVMCPEFVVIPPQIVLFNSAGQELIPRLPVGACGSINSEVLGTLATMTWQPLSVRLVSKVEPVISPTTFPGTSLAPGSPKVLRTGAATGVVNG